MLEAIARKRVFIGTLYLVAVVVLSTPRLESWWLGFAMAFFGEAVRTWSSGYIFKNETLATTGPYSLVRNPLYFGSFFLGFGITLMGGNPWLSTFYPVLFVPLYVGKIRIEERELVANFGEQAKDYFTRVPVLIPHFSNYRHPAEAWNLERTIFEHREWGNWLMLAGFAGYFYYLIHSAAIGR